MWQESAASEISDDATDADEVADDVSTGGYGGVPPGVDPDNVGVLGLYSIPKSLGTRWNPQYTVNLAEEGFITKAGTVVAPFRIRLPVSLQQVGVKNWSSFWKWAGATAIVTGG